MRGSTKIGQQRIITLSHLRESFATILYSMKFLQSKIIHFHMTYGTVSAIWLIGNPANSLPYMHTYVERRLHDIHFDRRFRWLTIFLRDNIHSLTHGEHNQIKLRCSGSADKWIMEKVARDSSAWKQPMRTKRLPLIRLLFLVSFFIKLNCLWTLLYLWITISGWYGVDEGIEFRQKRWSCLSTTSCHNSLFRFATRIHSIEYFDTFPDISNEQKLYDVVVGWQLPAAENYAQWNGGEK